jgi:transcriptional regulator with XRE-family HTH domain
MPKKPKFVTSLRNLREITGKTQVEFARALGCSPSTIKKIEGGDYSKLNDSLIMSLGNVFAVDPDSMLPPSTQPRDAFEGKPYTKEFFENWWKRGAEDMKHFNLSQKKRMVIDLETVLAAAMRTPGRGFGAISTSYYDWLIDLMDDCQLWPHYETEIRQRWGELRELLKKAKCRPGNSFPAFLSDMMTRILQDKNLSALPNVFDPKLLPIFDPNLLPTTLLHALYERKNRNLKKELPADCQKLTKLEKLKAQKYEISYVLRKEFPPETGGTSGPNRTR